MNRNINLKLSFVLAAFLATTVPENSYAQILEEIIVTAQKRAQNLSEVPVSVSAVSGDRIKNSGIQRAEDLSAYVPNFTVTQGPISDKINIRGIQSGNQAGFEQSVATVVDGIYRGRGIQARWSFFDVEQVEVLRGPQPTLFGINTVAGALNITTARPSVEPEAELAVKYNLDFDEIELQGFVAGPLNEHMHGRFALISRQMNEGWVTNLRYPEDSPDTDEIFARGVLEWDINENTFARLKYEAGDFDITGQPWVISEGGPIKPFLAAAGIPEGRVFETDMGNSGFPLLGIPGDPVLEFGSAGLFAGDTQEAVLKVEHSFSNGSRLLGIAGYSEYSFERFVDTDFNPLPVARFDDSEDFEQTSLELRLTSETGGEIEYIAGLYYQANDMYVDSFTTFNLGAINALLGGTCASLPGAAGSVIPGDAVGTAISVASLGGSNAVVANSCAQTALTQVLLPQGVNGAARYSFMDQTTDSIAAFAQATWNASDTVRASLGLRYTDQNKKASQGAYASPYAARETSALADQSTANPSALTAFLLGEFTPHSFQQSDPGMSRDDNKLTWSLNAQWDVTEDTMLYVSAGTGHKAGGFNSFYMGLPQGLGASSEDVAFKEEEVESFEIGAKMKLLDGAAELNVALFDTKYENLQASVFTGNATFVVQNAAEATSRGIEIDGRWQAADNLILQVALGLLDFEYDKFPNQGCVAEQFLNFRESQFQSAISAGDPVSAGIASLVVSNQSCAAAAINDLQGRPSAHSPKATAAFIADHMFKLGDYQLNTTLDLNWSDEVYRQDDLDPLSLQEAYLKMNAVLSLRKMDSNWDLSLIGNNLTNETTFTYVNDMPLFDGARFSRVDQPRNFSVRARYRF